MSTLTVRVDDSLREALEVRARATGTTISEVVHEALREALDVRPLGERIGHLRGILEVELDDDPWRKQVKERNWRA